MEWTRSAKFSEKVKINSNFSPRDCPIKSWSSYPLCHCASVSVYHPETIGHFLKKRTFSALSQFRSAWNLAGNKEVLFLKHWIISFHRLAKWLFRNDNCSRFAQFSHQICIFPSSMAVLCWFIFRACLRLTSSLFFPRLQGYMKRFTEINWIVLCFFFLRHHRVDHFARFSGFWVHVEWMTHDAFFSILLPSIAAFRS